MAGCRAAERGRQAGTRVGPVAALFGLLLLAGSVGALELDARIKYFASVSALPEEDLQRQQSGTPAFDDNLDLRLMFEERHDGLTWVVHHATTLARGDSLAAGALGTTLDQSALDDDRRLAGLTWTVSDGDHHRLVHRFDRLALRYRHERWRVTVGREALSWGNGLVFQPLDLFTPFAPTTVDQEFKAGEDLLLVERALADGGNLQLLAVGRRDADGDRTLAAGSVAAKLHRLLGAAELELVAGRHYRDRVLGAGWRFPVGGALIRADLVGSRLDGGGWKVSGIVNADYSLTLLERNAYLFAEYFHNGFGVASLPDDPSGYPLALLERLQRGELFNLQRDYVALGGSIEWHPLWSQRATLLGNLNDGGMLLQLQVGHDRGDHQRFELGVVEPLGSAGEEFGGVPLAGAALTVGGGTRAYLRWVYYF